MSETSSQSTSASPSSSPHSIMGGLGVLLGLVSLGFVLILPLFWPPASKWTVYLQWRTAALAGVLLSPWLMILGFGRAGRRDSGWLMTSLLRLLAAEAMFVVLLWLISDLMAIPYRLDRLMALHPTRFVPFVKASFLWSPILLALCFSLLVQKKLRNHLGLVLLTLGYQGLVLFGVLVATLLLLPKMPLLTPGTLLKVKITLGATLTAVTLVGFVAGTLLLESGRRLRTHLIFTVLFWLPLYGVFFFWSLVVDTTLYFVQKRLPIRLESAWQKVLVAPLCLLLFPLFLTLDFGVGLVRMFGLQAARMLQPDITEDAPLVFLLGVLLFFTLPFWGIPLMVYSGVRLFVYETILLSLSGRPAFDLSSNNPEDSKPS